MPEPSTEEKEGGDQPSTRDIKRARGEPQQDWSGEIPIPSAAVSPGASSSSGVKHTNSESTALPNSPGVSSGSGVKRAHGAT